MSDRSQQHDRHLIIGAGPVGLAMAAALKRRGIPFDHRRCRAGRRRQLAAWRLSDGAYRLVEEGDRIRDYPMPADYPDFPSADQMLAYLQGFAKDRDLLQALRLQQEGSARSARRCRPLDA